MTNAPRRVLIADQGTVAVRVIRSCREHGLDTVVLSAERDDVSLAALDADLVAIADAGMHEVGEAHIGRVIDAARAHHADAVHPGGGALSASSRFARACVDADLLCVGSPADVLDVLADGATFSDLMAAYDLGTTATFDRSSGRRISLHVATDGHGRLFHIADSVALLDPHGRPVLIESPASDTCSTAMLERVRTAAADALTQARFVGVGSVVFAVDAHGTVMFDRIIPSLQPDHAVAESVSGLDLVAAQFTIARGLPLPWTPRDIPVRGHALHTALHLSDIPDAAMSRRVLRVRLPNRPGVRIDSGITEGQPLSPRPIGPLLSLTATGETRHATHNRLRDALHATVLLGCETNRSALMDRMDARVTTVPGDALSTSANDAATASRPDELLAIAVASYVLSDCGDPRTPRPADHDRAPVDRAFSLHGNTYRTRTFSCGETAVTAANGHRVTCLASVAPLQDARYAVGCDGRRDVAHAMADAHTCWVHLAGRTWVIDLIDVGLTVPLHGRVHDAIRAPMSATVLRIAVAAGDRVASGQEIVVLEAMKLQMPITAPHEAVVRRVNCRVGDIVTPHTVLIELDDAPL